jgi:hypothetical protein
MRAQPLPAGRFVRRTQLGLDEYRKNFRQLDREVLVAVTSPEADAVTPLMSKIYLRLVNAPESHWEREGVLRLTGEEVGDRWMTAWGQLVSLVGVSSATARKALAWMHGEGIIGYFAGRNGVGIRIFLNRAASSIGQRPSAGQKNLRLVRASTEEPPTSAGDTPFRDSFADLEILEKELNPCASKNGAERKSVGNTSSATPKPQTLAACSPVRREGREAVGVEPTRGSIPVEEIVERLKVELEPCVREAAAHAAAQSSSREMERTREWFETKALPKAVRVAQRETYDLLRKHGGVEGRHRASAGLEVGRAARDYTAFATRPLTAEEIRETAEVCVALLETQGKSIEVTLSEISAEGGGWLLPEDAPRVREAACALALSWDKGGKG